MRLRAAARDRALSDYAKSIKNRELAEMKVMETESYLGKLNSGMTAKTSNSFLGSELVAFQNEIQRTKQVRERRVKNVARLASLESSRKLVYLEKEAEFKSLERFKERKSSEHMAMEIKKEEKELENVIGARFVYERVNL